MAVFHLFRWSIQVLAVLLKNSLMWRVLVVPEVLAQVQLIPPEPRFSNANEQTLNMTEHYIDTQTSLKSKNVNSR